MSDLSDIVKGEGSAPGSGMRGFYRRSHDYLDYKAGAVGAAIMGGTVGYINADAGILHASTAAAKQAAYTFVAGGFVMRLCQSLAQRGRNAALAVALSVLAPSVITIGATYGVHTLKGTPKPMESTIPTALLSPPAFLYWGLRKRKEMIATQQSATVDDA